MFGKGAAKSFGGGESAAEVCVENGIPIFIAHAHDEPIACDTGIIDEDVDPGGCAENGFGEGFDCFGITDINGIGPALAAFGFDFPCDFLGIFLGARNADDIGACIGEFEGDGATNTATCAGDNGNFVVQNCHEMELLAGEGIWSKKFGAGRTGCSPHGPLRGGPHRAPSRLRAT